MSVGTVAARIVVSAALLGVPALAPSAFAQQPAQLQSRVLPVAVGALVGGAVGFFVLPWVVPGTAVVAAAGVSRTAGPLYALIGAGIGGFIGYEVLP